MDKVEVDLILESSCRVVGVGVKAGATVTEADFKRLRELQDAVQTRFDKSVVLYNGKAVVVFGNNLYAVPISRLREAN